MEVSVRIRAGSDRLRETTLSDIQRANRKGNHAERARAADLTAAPVVGRRSVLAACRTAQRAAIRHGTTVTAGACDVGVGAL